MRICRYNEDKLGLVKGDQLIDVTLALDAVPKTRWPKPPGDALIANLEAIKPEIETNRKMGYVQGVNNVTLRSPVANPTKIIAAPANYMDHVAEAREDADINFGRDIKTIYDYGLFLKANSALAGAGEGITLRHMGRRNDHEIELAMIIGRQAKNVSEADALDYVAGYSIGLDNTVRGVEDRSLRKSLDSYAVIGPWMTTAEEIGDPDDLNFRLLVNGEMRQESNTRFLIFGCRKLIEYASRFYTLYPGDIIMTGTPQGVGPLEPGDTLECQVDVIGKMQVNVR
ncbi:MAG: FAA hydrolase family protein [Rhodospirillaceae bacterium]|nr:MAG: FAA hydrolase family protein [Rhodospirillaceae bacterium TMED63]RZO35111.1 MAG: FAA hydrolase family protein [Rhodospirillaceae bacterium]